MDKDIKVFIILSLIIHLFVFYALYSLFIKNRISFKQQENKIIQIQLRKDLRASDLFQKPLTNSYAYQGVKNSIDSSIEMSKLATTFQDISMSEKYNYQSTQPQFKKKYSQEYLINTDSIELPDWQLFEYSDGIQDEKGNYRKLIYYDKEALKEFNFLSDNEVALELTINPQGVIENITIQISTGDMDSDLKMVNTVSNWLFEKSENTQRGILKLKYFLK